MTAEDITRLTEAAAAELAAQRDFTVTLRAPRVFQVAALLQLALRHPGLTPTMREPAESLLAGVRAYFADCPATLDLLARGDDPRQDVRG